MPQMGPLPWLLIWMMVLCFVIIFISLIYFSPKTEELSLKSKPLKPLNSWKW